MSTVSETRFRLEVASQVLLRCLVFGVAMLFIWFGLFMAAPDLVYRIHGTMFGLTAHEVDVIHYSGMGFLKLAMIVLFLFPYIAIRMVLRKSGV
jgi:hypothetical protein